MASLIITIKNCKQDFDLPEILGKATVIGSDDSCDIILSEVDGLSPRHCTITYTEQGFTLEAHRSTNGTDTDGEEIAEAQLMKEGVVYSIGNAGMMITEPTETTPTTTKETPEAEETADAPAETENTQAEQKTEDAEETADAPAETEKNVDQPAENTPPKEAPAATPANKIRTHTRPLPKQSPAQNTKALSNAELQEKAKMLAGSYSSSSSGVITLYVVVILILAFYAGMALYSWQSEGVPVPAFFR